MVLNSVGRGLFGVSTKKMFNKAMNMALLSGLMS